MKTNGMNDILSNAVLILNCMEGGIYATNDEGIIIYSNQTAARILGYTAEEMFGQLAHDLFRHSRSDGTHIAKEECENHHLLTTGETVDVLDDVFWRKDGTSVPVEFASTTIRNGVEVVGIVVTFKDISKRKGVESRLLDQNEILEMIATGEPLVKILCFLAEMVEHQTETFCSILLMDRDTDVLRFAVGPSLPEEYIVFQSAVRINPEASSCSRAAYWKKPIRVDDIETDALWFEHRNIPFSHGLTACWSVPVLSAEHAVLGTLTIYFPAKREPQNEDLALLESYAYLAGIAIQRDNAEREIHYLAYHDSLTGLPNRRYFLTHAERAIQRTRSTPGSIAVVLIDMDRFKSINDSLGHTFGDQVLKAVAERLKSSIAPSHCVARMGGDEFLILMDQVASMESILQQASGFIDGLNQPLVVDGREFRLTASAGIALYPQDGVDLDTLIRHADRAMYYAKEMGGSGFRRFQDMKKDKFRTNFLLETGLQQALEKQQFYLDFQPKVSLSSGRVTGAEALVRWKHPQLGVISPGDFIPIAEETGLIRQLDHWVLETACKQVKDWRQRGLALVPVAVNLSTIQFQQPDLVTSIQHVLDSEQLDASWLEIEITETTLMKNEEEAMKKLKLLRQMGIRVSIDDFGVGYSCLALLQHLEVDSLKIDQAFVRNMDPKNVAIISTIIQLGHNLSLNVVAEGVETAEQMDFIRKNGCDEMQGFLFSRPVSPAQFEQLLSQSTPRVG